MGGFREFPDVESVDETPAGFSYKQVAEDRER